MTENKESDFQEKQERFQRIFDKAVMGIFECSPTGACLSINLAYARMHGYGSAEEMMSAAEGGIGTWVNPADWEELKSGAAEEEGGKNFEAEHFRKDGEKIWVLINAWRVTGSDGIDRYEGTCQDMTVLKHTEGKLRTNSADYQTLVEWSNVLIWEVDLNGIVTYINSSPSVLRGYTKEDVLGKPFTSFTLPEYAEKVSGLWKHLFETGEEQRDVYEVQVRLKTGELRWLMAAGEFLRDSSGRITGRRGIGIDVTERKLMELALKQSENTYRTMFENAGTATFLYDEETTIIYNVNPATETMTGYAKEELEGLSWTRLIAEEDLSRMLAFNQMRKDDPSGVPRRYEFRLVTKYGEVKDALVTVDKIPGTTKKIASLLDITERKRAEEALRKSDTRLRQVIDLVPHFIFAKDRAGRFILVNKTVADAYGTTVEGLTGKTDADFNMDPAEVDHFMRDDLRVMDSGRPMEIPEEKITDSEGRARFLQTMKIPFTLSMTEDDAVLGVSTDITERKRAEKALRDSEEKYRNIFENAVEGIFQSIPGGRFLSVNPAFAKMFGYDSAEELMETVTDIDTQMYVCAEDRSRFGKLLKQHGSVKGFEVQMRHRDGPMLWISLNARAVLDEKGEMVCLEGTTEDITRRKYDEQALLESEAKYRRVVESSLVGFYIVQDGLFQYVNPQFCEMSGYTADELLGKLGPLDLVHPEDGRWVTDMLERRLSGDTSHFENEIKARKKDGSMVTVKTLGGTLIYNGRPAATGTLIDVTRERTLETQLRQAQKVEAIGQLAGGVAHDFNNILTVLTGYASLLNLAMGEKDPLQAYVNQILSASEKASSLTQSLLAFSRQKPVTLTAVNINSVVRETEVLLKRLLREDIVLSARLAPQAITILADATQLDQILFNLATNAMDAMKKGGVLTIETGFATMDDKSIQAKGFGKPGRYAVLSVSDTGIGMNEGIKEKIFDPFFTTKEVGKGTGLGLSTVYGIVKQHDGYIVVDSKEGEGTAFHIYFPAASAEVDEDEPSSAGLKGGCETILIAEDDEAVRRYIVEVLRLYGYRVIEAIDGEDAVCKFMSNTDVDLMILDSVMPKRNGREAFDEIIKIKPDSRVLFTSGYTRDVVLDKGVQEKEFVFLPKPLSPGDLLQAVREVLEN